VVRQIRQLGAKVGVALRPQTGIERLRPCLEEIDLALLMTVNPGFGGQAFMPEVLPKIETLRKIFQRHIQVDGGINAETGQQALDAGANALVAGSYIFSAADRIAAIQALRSLNFG
jgi:ribulose-phosphate 3-epimerase